jgi:hypothetical protein
MQHIPYAILIQVITSYFFGWYTGAAAAMWYFIGREYAQSEYRLIEQFYGGKRTNMPYLAPLREARGWNKKSILDWTVPTVFSITVAYVMTHYFH